jgi:hypothetical protein
LLDDSGLRRDRQGFEEKVWGKVDPKLLAQLRDNADSQQGMPTQFEPVVLDTHLIEA